MVLRDAINIVRFAIDEDADPTIVLVNKIWTDAKIAYYIYEGEKEYAKETKGIEGFESLATEDGRATYTISGTALRSQGYKRCYFMEGNNIYTVGWMSRNSMNDFLSFSNREQSSTFPATVNFWDTTATIYPAVGNAPTSTLNGAITSSSTTLTLTDASDFSTRGIVTIGSEKIEYYNKSGNILQNLVRGRQGTVAADHATLVTVSFNNLYFEINKLPYTIPTLDTGDVTESELNKELEISIDDQNIALEYAMWKCLEKETDKRYAQHSDTYSQLLGKAQTRVLKTRQGMRPFDMHDWNRSQTYNPGWGTWRGY